MAKDKAQYGVVEGTIAYAKLAQADTKYNSKDTEYSVCVLVNEDVADEWDAKFKKQPATKFKASEFEGKFKIPVPEHLKGEKNIYQIKLKKDCVADGVEFYPEFRPKVLLDTADGERVDITTSRLIANGSFGKVSYRITTNDYGTFAKLANVLFDEKGFVEFESKGGSGGAGSEFGGSKPVTKKEPENKAATEARAPRKEEAPAKSVKAPPKVDEDDFEESPF